jgi:hypothetical protein
MKIDMLSRMIPFFDFNVVEKIAVDAVKHNFVAMKVNHLSGAVHFGNIVCGLTLYTATFFRLLNFFIEGFISLLLFDGYKDQMCCPVLWFAMFLLPTFSYS